MRSQVEFVQNQCLPWVGAPLEGVRAHAEARILSTDSDSGASSSIVRYPAGFLYDTSAPIDADEEIFVLGGSLEINGRDYRYHDYAFLPAGWPRRSFSTREGAVVLTFLNKRPALINTSTRIDVDPALAVEHLDVAAMLWDVTPAAAQMRPGCARKILRVDPRNEQRTWLLTSPPHGVPPGGSGSRERHPTVEEFFLLIGEIHGDRGTMRPGAYFWRPPGLWHGPYGSRVGATGLYRTLGGPLVAEWSKEKLPFSFDPPYDAVLPPALVTVARDCPELMPPPY